jgi:CYTH domain-containing protein
MPNLEIERKFLVKELPDLSKYSFHFIEQAYLCTSPVVRIRREDDTFYLTYKGGGMMMRREENLPLTEESYLHLLQKADGIIITKKRYLIPYHSYLIELDVFSGVYEGVVVAEVEFSSKEEALVFNPPTWFGEDVTMDGRYHNSAMSKSKTV